MNVGELFQLIDEIKANKAEYAHSVNVFDYYRNQGLSTELIEIDMDVIRKKLSDSLDKLSNVVPSLTKKQKEMYMLNFKL